MENLKVKLSMLVLFCSCFTVIRAQSSNPAAGGNAVGSGGTVSYTLGQVAYTSLTGATGTVNQGIQVPYEISDATGLAESAASKITCSAYPNPAIDLIKLKINNFRSSELAYRLYNVKGDLLDRKKIEASETAISMKNLPPAMYFLRITDDNAELKTIKIIKNQPF